MSLPTLTSAGVPFAALAEQQLRQLMHAPDEIYVGLFFPSKEPLVEQPAARQNANG